MDKALEMGKSSATGSFQLFIGKIVSTVILAAGTIIVTLFIQEGEYGLYTIALIPSTTILLFQDWGVGSALTKYCAQYRATNRAGDLRKIIVVGLTFEVATGVGLTLISLLMSNFIASIIFGKPESAFLMIFASITILSASLFSVTQSVFVGFERMGLSSFTIICQALAQGVLSALLVYLGYGSLGAVLGYIFSTVIACVISLALLNFVIFRKLSLISISKSDVSQTLRLLLRFGIPLAIATILGGILTQFYSFMMASFADVAMIGNYRVATNFAILLTFFTIPISTVLFPAFSKLNLQKEPQLLKAVFASSIKYTALFLVPSTMALMVLSAPIISTIYAGKWLFASSFLSLFVISNLFAIFGNLSMGSLLSGLGETRILMKLNILTLCIGVPLALLLIPPLGIFGVILVTIVAGVPSMIFGLHWTWKRHGAKADFRTSAKIFLASTFAATVTYLFLNVFVVAAWIMFTTGVILFLALYLTAAPLIGAINQTDVNNLRIMFSSMRIMSILLEIPLRFVEISLKTRTSRVETTLQ